MYLKNEYYRKDLQIALKTIVNVEKIYGKKVLITGATGLIAAFMIDVLLYANKERNANIEIYALARSEERLIRRFPSSVGNEKLHFLVQDVTEPLLLSSSVDYIVHAAGDGFPAAFREHPVGTMTPALFGTYQLLEYARRYKVEKFLYISSGEVYGKIVGERHAFRENESGMLDSMDVRSCYPMAKRCAETLCVSFQQQYHVPALIVRPSHIYGSVTSVNDNRASTQFLNKAVLGEDIVLYSDGKQMRSYTYVADCVSGIFTVLLNGKEAEAYNVANSDSCVTIAEFAEILAQEAGVICAIQKPSEKEKREMTPIEYAILDSTKLQELGWKPQYDISFGIKSMFLMRKEGNE